MLQRSKIVYFSLLFLLLLGNFIYLCLDKFNIGSFYFLTSSLFIIFPFISLFYILYLNIKQIVYKARKYDEISLGAYVTIGAIWLFVYSKLTAYIDLLLAYGISLVLFILLSLVFGFLNYKKGEIKQGPKIVSNR